VAEAADKNSSQKPKRRLKAAPLTVRERAEQSAQKTAAENANPKRSIRKSRSDEDVATKTKKSGPLRTIFSPLTWILSHIIPRYFKTAYAELRLTTWPNRKQSRQLTTAVVLFAIIFGIFVSVLDYGLNKLFKELFVK
jgi:preprotein translocase SecE subunit